MGRKDRLQEGLIDKMEPVPIPWSAPAPQRLMPCRRMEIGFDFSGSERNGVCLA